MAHAPAQRLAEQPGVGRARAEAVLAHRARPRSRSSRTRFARRAGRDPRRLEAEDPRRAGRHALEQGLEREQAGLDEVRVERGERGLEPGDAERRRLERDVLLVPRVRRVVGRDRTRSSPSRSASSSAARSRSARSGGFIFTFGSSERTASSVRHEVVRRHLAVAAHAASARGAARRPTRARRGAAGAAAAPRTRRARGRARPSALSATDG